MCFSDPNENMNRLSPDLLMIQDAGNTGPGSHVHINHPIRGPSDQDVLETGQRVDTEVSKDSGEEDAPDSK